MIPANALQGREVVAIVGSRPPLLRSQSDLERRRWSDAERMVEEAVIAMDPSLHIVVSGGARGVDSWARQACFAEGIDYIEIPALWGAYKKAAGYRRNPLIMALADRAMIFWDGDSRGTKSMVDFVCAQQGTPFDIFPI